MFLLMVSVVVFLLGLVVYREYLLEQDWKRFQAEHDCRVTSMIDGEWGNSTVWTCNDGITYEKNR